MTFEEYLAKTDYPQLKAEADALLREWHELTDGKGPLSLARSLPMSKRLAELGDLMKAQTDAALVEYTNAVGFNDNSRDLFKLLESD